MSKPLLIDPAMALQRPLEDYISYLEGLNPRSFRLLEKLVVPGVVFHDSRREFRGVEAVMGAFEAMSADPQRQGFKVIDYAWGRGDRGCTAYLRWICGGENRTEGISEIFLTPDGKVFSQTDYRHFPPEVPEKPRRRLFGV